MTNRRPLGPVSCVWAAGWLAGLVLSTLAHTASAQTLEVAPFGGYRFGGDLYEVSTGTSLDIDGAPSLGATLDVFVDRGTSVTFIYSHQQAQVDVPSPPASTAGPVTLSIDHWQLGGAQDVGTGAIRPFFGGSLGLTTFGHAGDWEARFSMSGGGGVKLMPSRHVGARLDGRIYAVFVDGDTFGGSICAPGLCVIAVDLSVVWQAEFTAGLVLSF
jgi:hypothetical protein